MVTLTYLDSPTKGITRSTAPPIGIGAIINKQGGGTEVFRQRLIVTLVEYSVAVVWLFHDANVVLQGSVGSIVNRLK